MTLYPIPQSVYNNLNKVLQMTLYIILLSSNLNKVIRMIYLKTVFIDVNKNHKLNVTVIYKPSPKAFCYRHW